MSVERDYAWAAGFFDGEGCVLYYYSAGRITTGLSVANCDERGLRKMQSLFGGRVRRTEKRIEGKTCYIGIWEVTGEQAENAAFVLEEYCLLKKRQLQLFMEARENTIVERGQSLTPKIVRLRVKYAEQIKSLKRPQWKVS